MVATNPLSLLAVADVDATIESISAAQSSVQYLEVKHYYPVSDMEEGDAGGIGVTSSTPTIQTIACSSTSIYLSTDDSEANEDGSGGGSGVDGNNHCCCSTTNNIDTNANNSTK